MAAQGTIIMTPEITWLAVLLAAPFVGSFLGVLVARLPAGQAIALGRSRCPHCRTVLSPFDLVPFVSWFAARGACRHCGARLGAFYPAIEGAALVVALCVLVVVPQGDTPAIAVSLVLGWGLLALAWIDARHLLLPDALTLPLAGAGLLAAWLIAPDRILDHAIGALVGYAAFRLVAVAYRRLRGRDGLGGGDAKLMAVAGAWLSWEGLPSVLLLGSVAALLAYMVKGFMRSDRAFSLRDKLAFGPEIAAAIWLVWLFGPLELRHW